ncbi:endonuclease/exonuclease/phosphatase family protein [Pseudopedobacter beijingensis]|uniref:Endonuclease/exonuclease/phosphatase family protein n=1 Tax=Pseudopedobacter beijingensis TaxID=1207056 RepID=A0ABW4IBI9_9SPHI
MLKQLTVLLFLFISPYALKAQQLIVGSFNLRLDIPKTDVGNEWSNRSPMVNSLIQFYEFDILGTQEGLYNQIIDLEKALPNYTRYGVGRDDGKNEGEQSAIFFRKDKFELLDSGTFWLSETPEKPSYGWDAQKYRRICSWALLKDKASKKKFYVYNSHYDHQANIARKESSKLILDRIKKNSKGLPVILTGDFNGGYDTEWYKEIANSGVLFDSQTKAAIKLGENPSFHEYGEARRLKGNSIIDHIFVSSNISVKKWGILSNTFHGKYPSDHFPIISVIELGSK